MHYIDAEDFFKKRLGNKQPIQIYFLKSVNDSGVPFLCAGGAIRDIFDENKGNFTDIDLFVPNEDEYEKLVKYIESKFTIDKKVENDFNTSLNLKYVLKIENGDGLEVEEIYDFQVQVIKFYASTAEELADMFDFTICQFIYKVNGGQFTLGEHSLMDLKNKALVINKIKYPLSTFRRFFKYTQKGFYACSGCLKTFMMNIRDEDYSDFDKEPEYID